MEPTADVSICRIIVFSIFGRKSGSQLRVTTLGQWTTCHSHPCTAAWLHMAFLMLLNSACFSSLSSLFCFLSDSLLFISSFEAVLSSRCMYKLPSEPVYVLSSYSTSVLKMKYFHFCNGLSVIRGGLQ